MMSSEMQQWRELIERLIAHATGPEGSSLPVVLTQARAARELSISQTKLSGMIRTGEIKAVWVGRRLHIPRSEIFRLATPKDVAVGSEGGVVPLEGPSVSGRSEGDAIRTGGRRRRRA